MTSLVRQLAARDVEVVWRRGDETKSATVRVGSQGGRGFLGVTPEVSNTLATIPADSALAKAGLQAGDRILSVDGKEVRAVSSPTADENARAARGDLFLSLGQIENAVRAGKGDAVELGVKRGDESLKLAVTPDKKGDGDLGIRLQHKTLMLRTGFVESVKRGCAEAMDVFVLTFQMLRKLVVREEEASNLSGPVGIMSASYKSAKEGLGNLLWLLGLISMNLAVINLLPIPILDGGHIMFLVVEKLRGKPVSEKVLMRAQVVGLLMLLSLVVFVTFHDVKRLFL
jgi:regulator of sigma E protease